MLCEDLPSNAFIFQNFHISYILNEGFVTQVTTLQITVDDDSIQYCRQL